MPLHKFVTTTASCTHVIITASCMQMEKVQASQHAKQGALQAAIDSLQQHSNQLISRHQQWAWKLASLLHWKRQGVQQLRRLLQSWAILTTASRSKSSPGSHNRIIRRCCEASDTQGKDGDLAEGTCQGTCVAADAQLAPCQACLATEDGMHGLRPVTDHHDRRLLAVCFRGTHACWLVGTPWFRSCLCSCGIDSAFAVTGGL